MNRVFKKLRAIIVSMAFVFTMIVPVQNVEAATNQLIIINTKYNKLSFYENNKLVKRYNVATGKPSTPTPTGKTYVANKIINRPYYTGGIPGGDPRNPLGDRWIGIFGGSTYAMHGNNNESSIGKHISGGCIRMHNAEIRRLFPKVKIGTTVLLDYSTKTDEQIAKKYGISLVSEGWKTVNGKKKYMKSNGKYAMNEWLTISGKKYHFNANGETDKGLTVISDKKYFFNEDGVMYTGWKTIDEFKYYFTGNGSARKGWLDLGGDTYYFDETCAMVTGTQEIDGKEYTFDENGVVQPDWKVVKGANRYGTAAEISKMNTYQGSTIVLVNGNSVADGITATPLAANMDASILLADKNSLPSETVKRINEIAPSKIVIIGGENAISKSLESKIASDYGAEVVRIAGKDRYETSFEIAKALEENGVYINKAYVVSGKGEPDALSVASKAGEENQPIILTNKDKINDDIYKWMSEKNLQSAYFIGGETLISEDVINSVNEITSEDVSGNRIAGKNREETNAKVIETLYDDGYSTMFAAKSNVLADALTAGPAAAKVGCPVLLMNPSGLSQAQKNALSGKYVYDLYQIGGGVSFKGMSELKSLINN